MQILDKILKDIPEIPVNEVLVGAFSTLVKAGELSGISSTLRGPGPHGLIERAGNIRKLNLKELASFIKSDNLLQASIGMAAINTWTAAYDRPYRQLNAKSLVYEQGQGKTVGVVGHFPFLNEMKGIDKLYIFEKDPAEGDFSEGDIRKYMPEAEVVVITGTSLINHTFEEIMKYVRLDAYKIVMGPSTPLSPVLFDYGVDAVCGTLVKDYEVLRRCVMEAVPVRYLQGKAFVSWLAEDYKNSWKPGNERLASEKQK